LSEAGHGTGRQWRALAVVELFPGQLDVQLQRDTGDTHFGYMTMAMLSDAHDHVLRMTTRATKTQSTPPRSPTW
jgi:hypothetical protein